MRYRRIGGMTQEELAEAMHVTKASVSKWETGQSHPDITLLPRLAARFAITVDELIGYRPQLDRASIRKIYARLAGDFAIKPFAETYAESREMIDTFYACDPLLFAMGQLYLNYHTQTDDPAIRAQMLEEAADLFARVRSRTEDSSLARTALQTEALVRIFQQNPEEALLLLENETQELMTSESVIAHAKMATGDIEGAKEALQVGIYLRLVLLTDLMVGYLALTGGEEIVWRETLRRLRAVSGTFQLRNLHPAMEIKILLTGAQAAAKLDEAWALDLLEECTELVSAALFPIQLRGDDYFDRMDGWISESVLSEDPPRDEKTIRTSVAESVLSNPAFRGLAKNPRYHRIKRRLERIKEGF